MRLAPDAILKRLIRIPTGWLLPTGLFLGLSLALMAKDLREILRTSATAAASDASSIVELGLAALGLSLCSMRAESDVARRWHYVDLARLPVSLAIGLAVVTALQEPRRLTIAVALATVAAGAATERSADAAYRGFLGSPAGAAQHRLQRDRHLSCLGRMSDRRGSGALSLARFAGYLASVPFLFVLALQQAGLVHSDLRADLLANLQVGAVMAGFVLMLQVLARLAVVENCSALAHLAVASALAFAVLLGAGYLGYVEQSPASPLTKVVAFGYLCSAVLPAALARPWQTSALPQHKEGATVLDRAVQVYVWIRRARAARYDHLLS